MMFMGILFILAIASISTKQAGFQRSGAYEFYDSSTI